MPQIVVGVSRDRQEQTRGRIDEVEMIETDASKLSECDGKDREIDAGDAEAKRQKSNDGATGGRNRDCREKADPGTDAEPGEQPGRDVGAEPRVNRMTERELPGKAHHDIPGLSSVGEIQNDDEYGEQIVVD